MNRKHNQYMAIEPICSEHGECSFCGKFDIPTIIFSTLLENGKIVKGTKAVCEKCGIIGMHKMNPKVYLDLIERAKPIIRNSAIFILEEFKLEELSSDGMYWKIFVICDLLKTELRNKLQ